MDPVYNTGNLPIALNSPLVVDGLVYAGDGKGFMNAWRAKDGKSLWRQEDGGIYHSGVVAYKENIIYGNSEGRVFSRYRGDGRLIYSVDIGAGIEGVPMIHKGRVFFHLRNHTILCLDGATGKILWNYRRVVSFLTTTQGVSNPVVYKDKLYVGFADGYVVVLSIEEGIVLWERKIVSGDKFVDVDTTPVFYQGKLVMGENGSSLSILNPEKGSLLRKLNYPLSRTPIIYNDQLIFGTTEGELVFLDKNFKEVKKSKISSHALSYITPWKGLLAVSTLGGEILLVDGKRGGVMETYQLGHKASAVFGNLSQEGEVLAVLSSRHRLYVFK